MGFFTEDEDEFNPGNTDWMSLASVVVGAFGALAFFVINTKGKARAEMAAEAERAKEEEARDPPRDFTPAQLRAFDGTTPDKEDAEPKAIYVAIRGNVYDVSEAPDFYGPGGSYHCFAGRDASCALARLSFEEADLADTDLDALSASQQETLDDWELKFRDVKGYPVKGRAALPLPTEREWTLAELAPFTGAQDPPPGRTHAPILVSVRGIVYDVSFGGVDFYGPGNTYNLFAGVDASRALAKMSFDKEDVASDNLEDLEEKQLKVLDEWAALFAKKYPIVGTVPHLVS